MTDSAPAAPPSPVTDVPWWLPGCEANARQEGWPLCSEIHCNERTIKNYTESYCTCSGQFKNGCKNNEVPGCCVFNAETAVPVADENCFCCCGCMANDTPVAFDASGYKAVDEFEVGDPIYVADDATLSSWSQQPVRWSAGAGGGQNVMLMVVYRTGERTDFLIVNRAQPFLMSDRSLKRAVTLAPGVDSLLAADGSECPVIALKVGRFHKGLHHVSTSTTVAKSVDKHLILAKGIVCGDWSLQVALSVPDSDRDLAPGHGSLPEVGTETYAETYADLDCTAFSAEAAGATYEAPPLSVFEPYGESKVHIPDDAQSFVTEQQAREIYRNVPHVPPNSGTGHELAEYLFKLFGRFSPPDSVYYLDNENQLPNAYSFTEFGRQTIVVTGGLVRIVELGFEGLALVLARQNGALMNVPPLNEDGYSCTGEADYAAVIAVMNEVFRPKIAATLIPPGIEQIKTLFEGVEKHRGGEDQCMHLTLDCRLEAMEAAWKLQPLPECAGGPPDPTLSVVGATGVSGKPHGEVTISFNEPVDPETATEVANYLFSPLASAYGAKVSEGDPSQVLVSIDLVAGTVYEVVVSGVLSTEKHPLTEADATKFTAKKGK